MKADRKLNELEIPYEEVVQENPTKSCDDAAKERGVKTRQIVKSLIIESEGEKFHVLLPGDRTLSERKFGTEYRMVPPEESEKITGFESGTVHPFSTDLKHIADERIFENERVSHTVGEKTRGVIIDTRDFSEALVKSDFEVEKRDIAVSTDEDIHEICDKGLEEESAIFVVNKGYRKVFLDLAEDFEAEDILNLLKAFNREGIDFEEDVGEKILSRADDQTHMQRLVESFSGKGELPEEESFNLEEKVADVIEENPGAVEDFQDGRDSAVNFFIGQIMKETNGKADAEKARKILMQEI